ncbi:hypothetical protein MSG28_004394 [Choristoneura fumiferana]|uniref:Uncharacterized protein n=1 Tax=Choristoneura fumiferana TaxID=7141 RepID=A0ACC0KIQ4_CHOFU|nr:hypothetical protein MSG28_004394 [Choristoneura fumiferana]
MDTEEGTPFPTQKVGGGWRRALERRVPLLAWAPRYSRLAAAADLVAGVTLGLTLVPQSIAYAALAGLPACHGLPVQYVTLLAFLSGAVVLLMGLLRLGECSLLTPQAARRPQCFAQREGPRGCHAQHKNYLKRSSLASASQLHSHLNAKFNGSTHSPSKLEDFSLTKTSWASG